LPVWRSSATINSALTCAFINAAANWIGDVTADSPALIWETHELPTLLKNPAVTRIIGIDPKTKKEILIFERKPK
jgi:hypothetical protein